MASKTDITSTILTSSGSVNYAMTGSDYIVALAAGQTATYSGSLTGTGTLEVSGVGSTLVLTGWSDFINPTATQTFKGSFIAGSARDYFGFSGANFRGSLYTILNPGAPTVVVDAGATLQFGVTTGVGTNVEYGTRGFIYHGSNAGGYNVANIEVNGTLRVEYTGYNIKLGTVTGTGNLVLGTGAEVFLVGQNTISGTVVNTTELYLGSNNVYGSLDNAKVIWNNGTLLLNTPYNRTLEVSQNIYENKWGNDININANGGMVVLSGVYSYSDSASDNPRSTSSSDRYSLNPTLSNPLLNYTAVSGNNSGRGVNIEGGILQFGNGTTTNFFLPGNNSSAYIDFRKNGTIGFSYSNSGVTYVNTTIAGGGLSFYYLNSPGIGNVVFRQGNIVLTAQQYYNGTTKIISGATVQLGDGTLGDTNRVNGLFQSSAGDGNIMQAGQTVSVRSLDGRSGSTSVGASSNQILNDGRIVVANVGATYFTNLYGSGSLIQAGAGTTTLGANTAYTGATKIYGGTLALGAGASIATSSGVALLATSDSPAFGTQSATAAKVAVGAAAFDISAAGSQTVRDLSGVTGTTVRLGANRLTVGDDTSTTYAGVIADGGLSGGVGGSLTKTGSGILTLTGVETYTGATTIAGGTLAVNDGGSIAASAAVTLAAAGSALTFSGASSYRIQDLSGVAGSSVTAAAKMLVVDGRHDTTYSGTLTVGSLLKTGAAGLTLTTAQTGIGGMTVENGILTLGAAISSAGAANVTGGVLAIGAGGSLAGTSGVALLASAATGATSVATFDISAAGAQTIRDLSGVYGTFVRLGANTLTVGDDSTTTYSGVIADGGLSGGTGGGLTKSGSGALNLTGIESYTGTTTVAGGTLYVRDGGSIAASEAVTLATAGSSLKFWGASSFRIQDLSGVAGTSVETPWNKLVVDSEHDTTYAGTIASSGLIKTGEGTLTLTADQDGINGDIIVENGILRLTDNDALHGNILKLGGDAIVDLSKTGSNWIETISGSSGTEILLGSGRLTLSAAHRMSYAGTIADGTDGIGSIQKSGSQSLTLSGHSTYSGGTVIEAGTLRLTNEDAAGTGAISFVAGRGAGTLILDEAIANTITNIYSSEKIYLGGFAKGDSLTSSYDKSTGLFSVTDQHSHTETLHFAANLNATPVLGSKTADTGGYALLTGAA